MVTQDVSDTRLLELAGILDNVKHYDQSLWFLSNGPGCALGHWADHIGKNSVLMMINFAEQEFGLGAREINELFSCQGCGDAKEDAKKAAAYIRDFVARRNPRVEVGNEGLPGKRERQEQETCGVV